MSSPDGARRALPRYFDTSPFDGVPLAAPGEPPSRPLSPGPPIETC